jgi:hypothetical protein
VVFIAILQLESCSLSVRIAKQAIYCPNYIIHDVVSLYQTTSAANAGDQK